MGALAANEVLDAALDKIATGDQYGLLTQEPSTFYEAVDPSAWTATTDYASGDVVRPTTRNGYVYEVTTDAGSSGASEPTWPTTPGNTVVDGGITWTCRANYNLGTVSISGTDFTNSDGTVSGRKTQLASKDLSIHTTGSYDHVCILDTVNQILLYATTAAIKSVSASGTETLPAWDIEFRDPTTL